MAPSNTRVLRFERPCPRRSSHRVSPGGHDPDLSQFRRPGSCRGTAH